MKNPSLRIWRGDWKGDMQLQSCSTHARLVWFETCLFMADGVPYGHLRTAGGPLTEDQHARIIGVDMANLRLALDELTSAGVIQRIDGAIVSRRMVRDEEIRLARALGGASGGNPNIARGIVPKADRVRWSRAGKDNLVAQVFALSNGLCAICGQVLTQGDPHLPTAFEIDHIIPLRDGGTNDIANLRAACKRCNGARVFGSPMANLDLARARASDSDSDSDSDSGSESETHPNPPLAGRPARKKTERRALTAADVSGTVLDSSEFMAAFAGWESVHGRYKAAGLPAQIKRLAAWGHDRAIAALVYSTAQGTQGIFEERPMNGFSKPRPTYQLPPLQREFPV